MKADELVNKVMGLRAFEMRDAMLEALRSYGLACAMAEREQIQFANYEMEKASNCGYTSEDEADAYYWGGLKKHEAFLNFIRSRPTEDELIKELEK